jgi:hypothetical protein
VPVPCHGPGRRPMTCTGLRAVPARARWGPCRAAHGPCCGPCRRPMGHMVIYRLLKEWENQPSLQIWTLRTQSHPRRNLFYSLTFYPTHNVWVMNPQHRPIRDSRSLMAGLAATADEADTPTMRKATWILLGGPWRWVSTEKGGATTEGGGGHDQGMELGDGSVGRAEARWRLGKSTGLWRCLGRRKSTCRMVRRWHGVGQRERKCSEAWESKAATH